MLPLLLIGAGIGGLAGWLSKQQKRARQKTEIDRKESMTEDQYASKKKYANESFNLERKEALETLGIKQNRLAEAFDTGLSEFNLGLEGQALDNQAARTSLAGSMGMARAQEGASGVKGSDTLSRRIEFEEKQFTRRLDFQDRTNSFAAQNMVKEYTNQFDDIGREIDSWKQGGYRYETKGLSDVYAQEMHGLEMSGFDYTREDMNKYAMLDYLTGILNGAGLGAATGARIGRYFDQKGKEK